MPSSELKIWVIENIIKKMRRQPRSRADMSTAPVSAGDPHPELINKWWNLVKKREAA